MTSDTTPPDGLEHVIAALQRPVALRPDLATRARRRHRRRVTQRVTAAAVLMIATVTTLAIRRRGGEEGVTFTLDAPGSRSVALVGDFTNWRTDEVRLTRAASGEWQVALKLPPGRYRFAYLVDNVEWRADSRAARATDDFGRPTSVIAVTGN